MSQTATCPNCGTLIGADDPYCVQCGYGRRPPFPRGCLIASLVAFLLLLGLSATCAITYSIGPTYTSDAVLAPIGWGIAGVSLIVVVFLIRALRKSGADG